MSDYDEDDATGTTSIIEFRFQGGRWERLPGSYKPSSALLIFSNYDLRIDGVLHLAAARATGAGNHD